MCLIGCWLFCLVVLIVDCVFIVKWFLWLSAINSVVLFLLLCSVICALVSCLSLFSGDLWIVPVYGFYGLV